FNICLYQGIETCVQKSLARFEPGAGGEHKASRGFLPTRTSSYHYLAEPRFMQAVADFLEREREAVQSQLDK
ncbi:MAG: GNAT family N-acetyltransferase, partial [Polyangiaceae bacterium]|nr:GNAT family N-acetyltransferase [Polyangiaceae bacterium]